MLHYSPYAVVRNVFLSFMENNIKQILCSAENSVLSHCIVHFPPIFLEHAYRWIGEDKYGVAPPHGKCSRDRLQIHCNPGKVKAVT